MNAQAELMNKGWAKYRGPLGGTKSPKKEVIAFLLKYKAEHPCSVCGESRPPCLEFHHRNRETKEFTIAQARQSSISIDRIEAEIAKCDVLCRNCHAVEESKVATP